MAPFPPPPPPPPPPLPHPLHRFLPSNPFHQQQQQEDEVLPQQQTQPQLQQQQQQEEDEVPPQQQTQPRLQQQQQQHQEEEDENEETEEQQRHCHAPPDSLQLQQYLQENAVLMDRATTAAGTTTTTTTAHMLCSVTLSMASSSPAAPSSCTDRFTIVGCGSSREISGCCTNSSSVSSIHSRNSSNSPICRFLPHQHSQVRSPTSDSENLFAAPPSKNSYVTQIMPTQPKTSRCVMSYSLPASNPPRCLSRKFRERLPETDLSGPVDVWCDRAADSSVTESTPSPTKPATPLPSFRPPIIKPPPGFQLSTSDQTFMEEDVLVMDGFLIDGSLKSSNTNPMQKKSNSESPASCTVAISPSSLMYKTELCKSWDPITGWCRYGPKCQFAHGKQELRTCSRKSSKSRSEICKEFARSGSCPFENRCRYVHLIQPSSSLIPNSFRIDKSHTSLIEPTLDVERDEGQGSSILMQSPHIAANAAEASTIASADFFRLRSGVNISQTSPGNSSTNSGSSTPESSTHSPRRLPIFQEICPIDEEELR